ncbi:MAG: alpha/beta hydrolase [Dongiaceae bacterium]
MRQEIGAQQQDGRAARGGGTAPARREDLLIIVRGGIENRLCVHRWAPAAASRGTLLCIHGLSTTGLDFEALAEALAARGLEVVAPDMPGHGRSLWTGSAAEMGPDGACGRANVAHCLAGLIRHYAPDPGARFLLGTSWGAVRLALLLAKRGMPARRVVLNDLALEAHPFAEETLLRLSIESELVFETLEEGIACLDRRQRELLRNRDSERVAPALLRRYLASQLMERDGRLVIASRPFREGMRVVMPAGYPDMLAILSAIAAERILLLYGSESPYRDSATQRRILQALPAVRSATIPQAGHAPRLLTPGEWDLLAEFLLGP